MTTADHWNTRYATAGVAGVSWYEPETAFSLELIDAAGVTPGVPVVDIGGGASPLVHGLLDRGFADVSVVDVSRVALDAAKERLGERAQGVTWIETDVLAWTPARRWGLWHDRAAFHFLTDPIDRDRYLATLRRALLPGGTIVIGTVAMDGPAQCSGLPVAHYDETSLTATLSAALPIEVLDTRRQVHVTPAGVEQPFIWLTARAAS